MKKEQKKLVNQKKELNHENSQIRREIREIKEEIEVYDYLTKNLSLMLKSKAQQTGHNRYQRILEKPEKIPEHILKFIKNIDKDLDKLLLHTTNDDIPTTNYIIELLFLTTLNHHDKRKYRTNEGVKTEMRLKTIIWNKRVVLGIK